MAKHKRNKALRPKREFELRKDVTVQVPTAILGARSPEPGAPIPWEDLYKDAMRQVDELHTAKNELIEFGSKVSTLCLAMSKLMQDFCADKTFVLEDGKILIPKDVYEQMVGASLRTGHTNTGDRFVEIISRGIDPSSVPQ